MLLTGGAGFIGGNLAAGLLRDGWRVDVADDLSTGDRAAVPSGAEFFEVDLSDKACIEMLPDNSYDAVLHLAGQSSGEKSFDDPAGDLDANCRSTVLLSEWALRHGVPAFIHASSMGVYGQPTVLPVAEDVEPRPISWYGASKLAAEQALAVAAKQGLRTVSLRMFSIYGPGQNLQEMRQGMVSIFLSMLLRGEPVEVHGSLDRVRDFVYVEDCVAAWLAALNSEAAGTFNVGSGVGTSVERLIDELCACAGAPKDHRVVSVGTTPGDQSEMIADCRLARESLGWAAATPLREGIEATVRWARDGA